MSNILLTEEEILDACATEETFEFLSGSKGIAKAQARHLVEWMKEYGFAVSDNKGKPIGFNLPWEKWEELKKRWD